jgi:hypothetical protein
LVVVNDKNSGRLTLSQAEGQLLDRVWRRSSRFGKEPLCQARQIPSPNRLVEMHATTAGDVAQALGRDIACQNNARDRVLSPRLYPGDDLEPSDAVRQVVVGDNKVGHIRPFGKFQRLMTICGNDRALTLVVKKQPQHIEHHGIVIDDEDRAACRYVLVYLSVA